MKRCSWFFVLLLSLLGCSDNGVSPQSPEGTTDGPPTRLSLSSSECNNESVWQVPPPSCRGPVVVDELLLLLNGNLEATFTSLADPISQLSDAMVFNLLQQWTGQQQSAAELARRIRNWGRELETEVLISDNVDESDGCLFTLRIPTDWLCETITPTTYESEQDCLFWHLPIWLELWPINDESVAVGILVGDPRIKSLVAIVSPSGLCR